MNIFYIINHASFTILLTTKNTEISQQTKVYPTPGPRGRARAQWHRGPSGGGVGKPMVFGPKWDLVFREPSISLEGKIMEHVVKNWDGQGFADLPWPFWAYNG